MIALLYLLQFFFRLVFFLPVNVALAAMNTVAWVVATIALFTPVNTMIQRNLKLVFPEANESQLAKKLIHNLSRSILELLCVPFFNHHHMQKTVKFIGLDNLPQNQGAILLALHTGNYELSQIAISGLGFSMVIIMKAEKDPLFKLANKSRTCKGAKLVNVLETDMYQAAQKALTEKNFIGTLADTGALESRHEKLDFLGHKVPVATGWLTLAQRSGCPVIPVFAHRANGLNIITIHKPAVITKENRDQVFHDLVKISEEFIRQHPEDWGMFINEYETKRMVGQ
jgi:KDO2-lipid IV(A) lauroyltransferase